MSISIAARSKGMVTMGLLRRPAAAADASAIGATLLLTPTPGDDGTERCGERMSEGANIMPKFSAVILFWSALPATLQHSQQQQQHHHRHTSFTTAVLKQRFSLCQVGHERLQRRIMGRRKRLDRRFQRLQLGLLVRVVLCNGRTRRDRRHRCTDGTGTGESGNSRTLATTAPYESYGTSGTGSRRK